FFGKPPSDLCVAAINCVLNHGRGLDDAIKHNRKAMMNVCRGDVAELLGAVSVESQMDYPAVFFVGSARVRNPIAGKVGLLFDQQTFFDRLFALTLHFIRLDAELRRNHLLSCVDLAQSLAVIGINQTELEFRYARELITRL